MIQLYFWKPIVNRSIIIIKGTRKPEEVETVSIEIPINNENSREIAPAKPVIDEKVADPEPVEHKYDKSNESMIEGTIFSDGTLYCVQLSSWKNKRKAEQQVQKYKKLGHNSFYTEAYIAKKRSTWYRVRVGYFDSLTEARKISGELK